jgi:hypothetical protein
MSSTPSTLTVLLLLTACAPPPAPAQTTIPDVSVFLVQSRCPNGRLEVAQPGCRGAAPQRADDPMLMRRHDWPPPTGYEATESFLAPNGKVYETIFGMTPFGPMNVAHGDGGEVYVVEGGTVRIAATQDGGQMGVIQGFYGKGCGGDGWILFRDDAPTGAWATTVARLRGRPLGSVCSASSHAFTRYRLEMAALPFVIDGSKTTLTLPTVITEHFNAASLERSTDMERSFMVKGLGRAIWESWSRKPRPATDIQARCPLTAWSTPPGPGWDIYDCRYNTNLVAADGKLTGRSFGWTAADLPLP